MLLPASYLSDPLFEVEFYAVRVTLLILLIIGLYRLVRNEIRK
jgi:hypothetical protein